VRKRLNYFKYSVGLLVLQKNIVLLITVTAIFSSLLAPVLSFDFAVATSEEEEEEEGGDNDDGGDDDNDGEGGGDQPEPEPEPEREPEPGLIPGSELPMDPYEANPEEEGFEAPVCSCPPGGGTRLPRYRL
jgi:hypothetical protein